MWERTRYGEKNGQEGRGFELLSEHARVTHDRKWDQN